MSPPPIRVLLVEDSLVALTVLKRMLSTDPELEVVATAPHGEEALRLIPLVQPNVICTDLHMPKMNGLEFTKAVMSQYPIPILVVSASVQREDTENVFQLLAAGAVDVFPKPSTGLMGDYDIARQDLISRIKVLAGVKVFTKHRPLARVNPTPKPPVTPSFSTQAGTSRSSPTTSNLNPPSTASKDLRPGKTETSDRTGSVQAIVIGASTGGPQALQTILTQLPAHFPVPVICIQHISEGFLQGLVNWLNTACALPVTIAQSGEIPLPGHIYFAPERHHLEFDSQGRFLWTSTSTVDGHCPSVTVTFSAIAKFYGSRSIGVLLTGMGRDGATGLQNIALANGWTIAQDEKSCVVFGMPKEAIALGAARQILPLQDIASILLQKIGRGSP